MHSRSANQDFYAGEALDLMEDLEAGSLVLSSMRATKTFRRCTSEPFQPEATICVLTGVTASSRRRMCTGSWQSPRSSESKVSSDWMVLLAGQGRRVFLYQAQRHIDILELDADTDDV